VSARAFIRASLGVALSQYLSRAVMLARGLIAAAALGPAGFGAWNALNLILDYGVYSSLGALYGLDLGLPPAIARGDRAGARRAMRGAWGVSLAGSAAFAAAVALYLSAGMWLALTGWGWSAPLLMLLAVFVQVAIHYHAATLRAHGDFGSVSTALTLQAVIGGGIGLATVWRAGVWGLLWGWLAGGLIALAWLRRSLHRPPLAPATPAEGLPMVRAGFPLFAFFALTLVIRSIDRIALVRFGGNEALGRYSLGLIAAGLVLYPPEAVASVLFPRIAAAAQGARDPDRTRAEVTRAQRALTALLPAAVGLGVLWAGPLVRLVLPAFGDGVVALRVLGIGAMLLAVSTLPGYYLLGSGKGRQMLALAAGAGLLSAMLVFGVAARVPHVTPVAVAAAAGQGAFAAAMLWLASRWLADGVGPRRALMIASFAPAVWAGVLVLALTALGPDDAVGALWRSAVFAVAYAPAMAFFARGLGLRSVLREWFRSG